MIAIDGYAYSSKIARVSPKAKLFCSLVPLALCILLNAFSVSLLCIGVMGGAVLKNSRLSWRKYLAFLGIPMGFLILGTVTILINRYLPEEPLLLGVQIGGYAYGISPGSLMVGGGLILKSLAAVSCMYFLSFNTPMVSLFQTLRTTRLPGILISLMELIYRYIFVFWEEAETMKTAQNSRLGYTDFKTAVSSMGMLISSLFLRAYQRCDRTFAALESRGYDGDLDALTEDYTSGKALFQKGGLFCLLLLLCGVGEKLLLNGWS